MLVSRRLILPCELTTRCQGTSAGQFAMARCGRQLMDVYEDLLEQRPSGPKDESGWHQAAEEIRSEWELLKNMAEAVGQALK